MNSTEGKIAVVAGVGSGIGQAIAQHLAREGAQVMGCDTKNEAGSATMSGLGLYVHADVCNEKEVVPGSVEFEMAALRLAAATWW